MKLSRRSLIKLLIAGIIVGVSGTSIGYIYSIIARNNRKNNIKISKEPLESNTTVRDIATDLEVPWSIAQVDENSYIVSERPGRLVLVKKNGDKKLIATFNVARVAEAGLLGVALHPEFDSKPLVYIYLSYRSGSEILNRVISARIDRRAWKIESTKTLIDRIPGAPIHDGGRIRFGPDNRLYITTGDAANPKLAQRLDSLAGKILRIEDDGTIPSDNPFEKSPIYSYGHRNPQGLDWSPITGSLIATEHGPVGHDEVNKIVPGGNYGWPIMTGTVGSRDSYILPLIDFGSTTIAPSGASFVTGEMFKEYFNNYLIASLRGRRIVRIVFDEGDNVIDVRHEFVGRFGRVRDVVIDRYTGAILLATSNRDGRGSPRPGDDRIIMLERKL